MSMTIPEFGDKWFIYVTNWGYTVCTLEVTIVWLMLTAWTITYFTEKELFKKKALKMYRAFWLLNTIATPLAFGITTVYWIDFWPPKLVLLDFLHHGNNSIIMLLDLWLTSHKLRYGHVGYQLIFGFIYAIFSYIYYSAGGTNREYSPNIYKRLSWGEHPYKTAILCFAIDAFLAFWHCIVVFSSRFRSKIAKTCKIGLDIEQQIAS